MVTYPGCCAAHSWAGTQGPKLRVLAITPHCSEATRLSQEVKQIPAQNPTGRKRQGTRNELKACARVHGLASWLRQDAFIT